ncbi:hypothetical protein Goarm_007543, partial [Gossypium armourianum]|nr:hypothetical protein [Gossypium armourianum]
MCGSLHRGHRYCWQSSFHIAL